MARPYSSCVRCFVEPSPAGGYFVRLAGEAAPVSRHDTEEEAEAAAAAYDRGLAREDTAEHVVLRDGSEALIRAVRPEDKPLFVAGWTHLSSESVRTRFLQTRNDLYGRRTGVLHRDRPRRPRGDRRAGRRHAARASASPATCASTSARTSPRRR